MKVDRLCPAPDQRAKFAWSHQAIVPEHPGCYALVTYSGDVLYVGLAEKSIRKRMGSHLDTPTKQKGGPLGVPFWFYYVLRSDLEVHAVERGWMNQAILEDGNMPHLNQIYSPL